MLFFGAEKSVFSICMHDFLGWKSKKNLSGKQTERSKHIFTHLETVYCFKCCSFKGVYVFKGYLQVVFFIHIPISQILSLLLYISFLMHM